MFDDIKFPKHPVTPVSLDKFTLMFRLKMQHTGCDRYIRDNKKKRPKRPSRLDRKAYRKWNKDMEWIAVALQTCLLGHEGLIWIKNETNGVKAWDILMKHFDVRTINPGAARTGDLTALIAIQLTSIARGCYGNYCQKFEKTAAYIKIEGKPLRDELKYDFFLNGIKHDGYSSLMTTIKTQIPPFTYVEVQNKLLLHSNAIETTSKADTHNTRTVANMKINGYTVDEKMRLSNDKWEKLTQEQKDAFVEKRKQLRTKRSFPSNQNNGNENAGKEKEKTNQHQKL